MLKVILRMTIFFSIVGALLSVPFLINRYAQKKIIPLVPSLTDYFNFKVDDFKVRQFKYAFPIGLSMEQFSANLGNATEDVKEKSFRISGDETYVSIIPTLSIFSKIYNFEIGSYGLLVHPVKNEAEINDPLLKGNNDYVQLISRKFNFKFECKIDTYDPKSFIKEVKNCFVEKIKLQPIELGETYFDLFFSGEKRLISVKKLNDRSLELSKNDVDEAGSIFREPIDASQQTFMEKYPFHALYMLNYKKKSEMQTRNLEINNRYKGISVNQSYFYYLIAREFGSKAVDLMKSWNSFTDVKFKEEFISSALLGKLSFEKGVKEEEILKPEFFSRFAYQTYSIPKEGDAVEESSSY